MPEEWITVKDAARLRQCAERTIIDKIHKGVLQGKKDGRRWLVLDWTHTSLDELLGQIKGSVE